MAPALAIVFANTKGNLGDLAILHAMLLELARKFPARAIHVYWHGFHVVDERRLSAFKAACNVPVEFVGPMPAGRVSPLIPLGILQQLGAWPFLQPHLVRKHARKVAQHAEQFKTYEAIVVAGGDHGGGARAYISMHGVLRAIRDHNDQFYAFPFSVNEGMRRNNRAQDLRTDFGRLSRPIVVRDSKTKEILSGAGVDTLLGADAAYSLERLAGDISPARDRNRERILFVLTGKTLRQDLRKTLKQLGAVAPRVEFMTTCECVDGQDYLSVAREFDRPYYAPLTWQEVVAEMKSASVVVSNRLHGLILGSLAGTPLLPVTDRSKSKSFAEDVELPYVAADVRSLTTGIIEKCEEDRDAVCRKIGAFVSRATNCSPFCET